MSVKALPDDVVRFLNEHIESVEQLEVLLLLHRAGASAWTADMVAAALYTQPASAARRLAALHEHGLIEQTPAGARPPTASCSTGRAATT